MSLRILRSDRHPALHVYPFGPLPCDHEEIQVHTTNGEQLADDMVECPICEYVITLRDLYAAVRMPPGLMPG